MSAFSGPQGKGTRKRHKDAKRRTVSEAIVRVVPNA